MNRMRKNILVFLDEKTAGIIFASLYELKETYKAQ